MKYVVNLSPAVSGNSIWCDNDDLVLYGEEKKKTIRTKKKYI